ncbi:MAG: YybH family protein [Pirellulales bacterium]
MLAAVIFAVSAHAAETKPDGSSDVAAIRAALGSYVAAYNRGDAKAVAAHWSESGEWRSPTGQRFEGRKAIEKELEGIFAENKGVRIECGNPTVRLVSSDVATEEGTVRVVRPGEAPSESTYLAIHVKKDGQWKLDSVHETSVPEEPATSPQLENLAWLVGEWIDSSPDSTIETNVSWTKNKTFLSYAFKASLPGMDDLEGTQVIGWDPAAGTIRSWMFDSDGGFGEGTWSNEDNRWIVKFSQVLPDGRKATATNIYTLVDANTFTWKSIGRKVGDEFLPNIDEVKVVRKSAAGPAKGAEKPSKDNKKPEKQGSKK